MLTALVVGLATGGDDEADEEAQVRRQVAAAAPDLGGEFVDPRVGVTLRRPEDWTARRRRGAVRVASPDRSVIISISSPAPARDAEEVLSQAVAVLEERYRNVETAPAGEQEIGGQPTNSTVVSAETARGTALRVLVASVAGRDRAYLIEVFAAAGVKTERLAEGQAILSSLRLTR